MDNEIFLFNYQHASDQLLMINPIDVFTGFSLPSTVYCNKIIQNFTPTKLELFSENLESYIELCGWPRMLIALNSNYLNICCEGYEQYMRQAKDDKYCVGNGSSFGSCVEFVMLVGEKIYKIRCFPDGKLQIPGMRGSEMGDSLIITQILIDLFNNMIDKKYLEDGGDLNVVEESSNYSNYNFRVWRSCPRIILNLPELQQVLLEQPETPYKIFMTRQMIIDNKISFSILMKPGYKITIRIQLSGKIGMMAIKNELDSKNVYEFLKNIFKQNWNRVVCIIPRTDKEIELIQISN